METKKKLTLIISTSGTCIVELVSTGLELEEPAFHFRITVGYRNTFYISIVKCICIPMLLPVPIFIPAGPFTSYRDLNIVTPMHLAFILPGSE